MGSGRIVFLDLVKLFTIFQVIMGHVIAMMVDGYTVGGKLYAIIYSFHMPLFMLLSGYFANGSTIKKPFVFFLTSKAKQLLLPTVTCTVTVCIYLYFCREVTDYRVEIIGNSWFLKTLFVYYIFFYLMKKTHINDWVLFVGSCASLFLIPGCSSLQVNLLFPYFWGGYFLKKYHVLEHISGSWKYAALFLLVYIASYSLQQTLEIPNYIEINMRNVQCMGFQILLRYFVGLSGSMSVISIISVIYKYIKEKSYIEHISYYGRWTLGIYVLQTILVINVFPDTLAWYVESELLLDVVIAPLLSLAFLLVCLCLIYLISKNRLLDLLFFGGQYYKKNNLQILKKQ